MRIAIARSLRKWADLIDPRTAPRSPAHVLEVRVECDASQFEGKLSELSARLQRIATALDEATR